MLSLSSPRLSTHRGLLIALLLLFTALEAVFAWQWATAGFHWRALIADPGCRAAMLDFVATATWLAFYILDRAQEQDRHGWAWMPLLVLCPTLAILLFQLTAPRPATGASRRADA